MPGSGPLPAACARAHAPDGTEATLSRLWHGQCQWVGAHTHTLRLVSGYKFHILLSKRINHGTTTHTYNIYSLVRSDDDDDDDVVVSPCSVLHKSSDNFVVLRQYTRRT